MQKNAKHNMKRLLTRGFTLVEISISVGIALIVLLMIYRFLSNTRHHYMYGTVNLQNLQEARLAVNYLRRDFSCACPRIGDPASTGYVNLQKTRNQVFVSASFPALDASQGELIQIDDHGLHFHKFVFGSPDVEPRVELVRYDFDQAAKTLMRFSEDGKIQKFTGFEEVEFKVYTHQLNPGVPLLWVRMKVHEGENIYGKDSIGKALELTTSISSPFLTSSVNNKFWRYETGHKKL